MRYFNLHAKPTLRFQFSARWCTSTRLLQPNTWKMIEFIALISIKNGMKLLRNTSLHSGEILRQHLSNLYMAGWQLHSQFCAILYFNTQCRIWHSEYPGNEVEYGIEWYYCKFYHSWDMIFLSIWCFWLYIQSWQMFCTASRETWQAKNV
jgi:hypothetical protein